MVTFIAIEHLPSIVGGFAHGGLEVNQLTDLIRRSRSAERESPAVLEIPTVQRQALGHQLGQLFPTIQGGVFEFLTIFEDSEQVFELNRVGIAPAFGADL